MSNLEISESRTVIYSKVEGPVDGCSFSSILLDFRIKLKSYSF